jgi:hypothetical protein
MINKSIMAAALAYATRGWSVFPAPPEKKKSFKSAKHSNGRNWGMTADPEEIRRDWRRWPSANVGIPTGAVNGIWVLEADTLEGHDVDGIAALRRLEDENGRLPDTLMAVSPSGSIHYYFKWPTGAIITNSASKIAPGIDVRGEGGMVIAPPSIKAGVGIYKWLNDGTYIADAPDWLVALAASKAADFDDGNRERNEANQRPTRRAPPPSPPPWLALLATADTERGISTDRQDLPPPADVAKIEAALDAVDPDIGYATWIAIGAALLDELGDARGFEFWDRWSGNGHKYPGRPQTAKLWREFIAFSRDLHIGTVFHHATEADPDWRRRFELNNAVEVV